MKIYFFIAPMTPLRKRMLDYMHLNHYSASTIKSYIYQVAEFSRYIGKSPELSTLEDLSGYLLHLSEERQLSQSLINAAYSAIKVVYIP